MVLLYRQKQVYNISMRKIFTLAAVVFIYCSAQAQAWIELGTGGNALRANNSIWALLADHSGNIYAAGGFTDSATYISGHSYVARWNGSVWSTLGTDTTALNANNAIYSIVQDISDNIYAAGNFTDVNGNQYVAKWNGTNWSELGGLNATQPIFALATDVSAYVYAASSFTDSVFPQGHNYVAQWNGSRWTELGYDTVSHLGGIGADSSIYALATGQSYLYAAGAFIDTGGYRYVARWNGHIWAPLGADTTALRANGAINALITDTAGNVYVGGTFTDSLGYYYIAKWNGHKWTELRNTDSGVVNQVNILGPINALTLDSVGNVYAGGMIPDSNGNFFFVVVWNGSQLLVANNSGSSPLNANAPVLAMISDKYGNIYAAGNFTDNNAYQYVAEFTGNIPNGVTTVADERLHIYPNPTSGLVFIQADHLSGATTIEVLDGLGRPLYAQPAEGATIQAHIDLSAFSPGIYTLLIRDQGANLMTRRIVKE
jgi:hypothetical protein